MSTTHHHEPALTLSKALNKQDVSFQQWALMNVIVKAGSKPPAIQHAADTTGYSYHVVRNQALRNPELFTVIDPIEVSGRRVYRVRMTRTGWAKFSAINKAIS